MLSRDYVAGLIDGEGCILVNRNKRTYGTYYYMDVSVANTFFPVLESLRDQFGGSIYPLVTTGTSRQQCYKWETHGSQTLPVLWYIDGHCVIKAEQARLGLEMAVHCDEHRYQGHANPMPPQVAELRHSYYQRIKALKRPDLMEPVA